MKRVAIIENSPTLAGDFRHFLEEQGIGHRTCPAWRGASLPPRGFDGYILTGDLHNVTDGLKAYHRRELELLEEIDSAGVRVFASCFAHQLVAAWKGGRVQRRASRLLGWERVGVFGKHPALEGIPSFDALCMNTDEVAEPPAEARALASSAGCLYQVLAYGDSILTCQSHPERLKRRARGLTAVTARALAGGRQEYLDFKASRAEADDSSSEAFIRQVVRWLVL